jgi:hypothetical protein
MALGRPVQPGTIAAADFVTNTNGTVGLPRAAVPAKTWNSLPNAFTYVHGLPRALRRLVDGCLRSRSTCPSVHCSALSGGDAHLPLEVGRSPPRPARAQRAPRGASRHRPDRGPAGGLRSGVAPSRQVGCQPASALANQAPPTHPSAARGRWLPRGEWVACQRGPDLRISFTSQEIQGCE